MKDNSALRIVKMDEKPAGLAYYNASQTSGNTSRLVVLFHECYKMCVNCIGSNACSKDNGGCPQLCLPIPDGRRCACTSDNTSDCQPAIASSPDSLTVDETSYLTLSCTLVSSNATGLSYISAQWLKDGDVVESYDANRLRYTDDVSITIRSVNRNDSGSYVCVAVNKYGRARSTPANVTVRSMSNSRKLPSY